MVLSNNQIRKLGDRLRNADCNKANILSEDLQLLQEFRIAHKDSLVFVFNELSKVSKTVHKDRIVSFRTKKIDTILSKLVRQPEMELDRMGDIAGCRCIVQSVNAVYEIAKILDSKFTVKAKDMIKNPDNDGYKSLHLYVRSKEHPNMKTVEIQLRTMEQHNWATLVEIMDVVFETKIKEGGRSKPKLNEFLYLFSNLLSLEIIQKNNLVKIEMEYKIYSKLLETFQSNIIKLRKEWMSFEKISGEDNFLVFEVNPETKITNCTIFSNYKEAEDFYYNKFISASGDLLVTHLNSTDFKKMNIAYSNYILTNHHFQDAWLDFLLDHVEKLVDKLDIEHILLIGPQISELIGKDKSSTIANRGVLDKELISQKIDVGDFLKLNKWFEERDVINEQRISKINEIGNKLNQRLEVKMKGNIFTRIRKVLKSI